MQGNAQKSEWKTRSKISIVYVHSRMLRGKNCPSQASFLWIFFFEKLKCPKYPKNAFLEKNGVNGLNINLSKRAFTKILLCVKLFIVRY